MKTIIQKNIKDQSVSIAGSKSITHRMLICAALCRGSSIIENPLESEDTAYTMQALSFMGAGISPVQNGICEIKGFGGSPNPCEQDIYLGNSGTSMRLLTGIAALGTTKYCLTGDRRMCQRPIKALIDALKLLNIHAEGKNNNTTPPVTICGKTQSASKKGGKITLDCSISSQYLSSLLMTGPFMEKGLEIKLCGPVVSSPYIDLTLDVMNQFNIEVCKINSEHYKIYPGQTYQPGNFKIEPDLSNAGYFWAVGAVSGKMIYVRNIRKDSLQGDFKQLEIFEKMGCSISIKDNKTGVCGRDLKGIDIDMSETPDAVPAIAVTACFAKGCTRIKNIQHLREKECDRINVIALQLQKMGIEVKQSIDSLEIQGGNPKGAQIETFNDHRIAMAFSIPGLIIPGMEIQNPACVQKSFPDYWKVFDGLSESLI